MKPLRNLFALLALLSVGMLLYITFWEPVKIDLEYLKNRDLSFMIYLLLTLVYTLLALWLWGKIKQKEFEKEMEEHRGEKTYLEQLSDNILTEYRNETNDKKEE